MRLYSVTNVNDDDCVVVVANNSKEAKKMGLAELYCEFIDAKVHWIKGAEMANEKEGIYTDRYNALKNGWHSWIEDTCPICGKYATIGYDEDHEKFKCLSCKEYFILEE